MSSLFKKFVPADDISSKALLKSSIQRGIRKDIAENYPSLAEEDVETIMPRKASVIQIKCRDRINVITVDGATTFFQVFDGPLIPTLRVIHKFPHILPQVQIDKGAIKHIIQGADIMTPGLTSPGGKFPANLSKDQIVAVFSEGHAHALAVGTLNDCSARWYLREATFSIASNSGHAITNMHHLGDGLWRLPEIN